VNTTKQYRQKEWLAQRHANIDAQVSELTARAGLTPTEQVRLTALKREKLRVKDQLSRMRS